MTNLPPAIEIDATRSVEDICTAAKAYLNDLRETQLQHIARDFDAPAWVHHYTQQIDRILITLFDKFLGGEKAAVVAIGGYGRGELFPCSDIDILLLKGKHSAALEKTLESYIQCLWSLGLDIAQSVRTPREALKDAKGDCDTLTSLIDARHLAGNATLTEKINVIQPPLVKPLKFFNAKIDEQNERDSKQSELGLLEPNIKTGNGGLRDLQMIMWLYKYCWEGTGTNYQGLLTEREAGILETSRNTLWQIRFALHLNRRSQKDRLSFDQQKILATAFGYEDGPNNQAVERFMRHYYRAALRIRRLNRLAIKLVDAQLHPASSATVLDDTFLLKNHCLVLRHPEQLEARPEVLWQIFLCLLDHPEIRSISPELARQIKEMREQVSSDKFRKNTAANRLFIRILNHDGDIFRQLRRMHRYGILSRYLPGFSHSVGLMQFDLFHEYTVDQHTLRLIYFLDKFKQPNDSYPMAETLIRHIHSPAILYLAALFHDLGKGLDGDHSVIGVDIAEQFLQNNPEIDARDGELLKFLIRNHLKLSMTAQKRDLSDPEVIAEFAHIFPDREYLDYLYLLTLADISATNGNLWNSWRSNLLSTLYRLTRDYLDATAPTPEEKLEEAKQQSLALIPYPEAKIKEIWENLPQAFFLNEPAAMIAKKTTAILANERQSFVVHLRNQPVRIFLCAPISPDILLARATHFMEKHNLDIVEARVYSDFNQRFALQQFTLNDQSHFDDELLTQLRATIATDSTPKPLGRRISERTLRYFDADTKIKLRQERTHQRTVMELTCKDRHGLLSLISGIFLEHHIHLSHAKIATIGERVEDTFYLTNQNGLPITDAKMLDALQSQLIETLQQ